MSDPLSKDERSVLMSKIRSGDTKPEWILRRALHQLGFRYRLRNRRLPGRPDLTFPKYQAAIFVHGCYWHRHPGCENASTPKTNAVFWAEKFAENVARDRRVQAELERLGWRVMVVWECELTKQTASTIRRVADWLVEGCPAASGVSYDDVVIAPRDLLSVADRKVRYRIASYDRSSSSGGRETDEVREQ